MFDTYLKRSSTPDPTMVKKPRGLKYGPFRDIKPLTFDPLMIHFKYGSPMPIFSEAWKQYEVSHWGNILVNEYFMMHNEAAAIKGEWGRVDFNKNDHQNF